MGFGGCETDKSCCILFRGGSGSDKTNCISLLVELMVLNLEVTGARLVVVDLRSVEPKPLQAGIDTSLFVSSVFSDKLLTSAQRFSSGLLILSIISSN